MARWSGSRPRRSRWRTSTRTTRARRSSRRNQAEARIPCGSAVPAPPPGSRCSYKGHYDELHLGAMAACRLPDDRSPVGAFVRTLPIESLEKDDLASAATLAWRARETSLASAFLERFTDQDELGRAIRDMADESLVPAVIRKLPGLP